MLIHLKPTASEGPFLTLFHRDILSAYRDIDLEIADVALKYFLKHATSGAYSPCMQGMHCMPSHLAKKENNNLNKYMQKFKTKSN